MVYLHYMRPLDFFGERGKAAPENHVTDVTYFFHENLRKNPAMYLEDPLIKKALREVDHFDVSDDGNTIQELSLQGVPVDWICKGTKNLANVIGTDGYLHNLSMMGENVYPFAFEKARSKDIHYALFELPDRFTEDILVPFANLIVNYDTGRVYNTRLDVVEDYVEMCNRGVIDG